ncbi:PREDICTED: LOC110414748 isoform [Prunus dulcis]|uniref:PREDICTED: LOC110414748 isoform n=1 Tax=Prunus dulcis TaxID=3755 RepID=A0A5E4GF23_PRUDU|nr:PREDICTED: LOC110414748 isoform [Prunus dulcis]
MHDELVTIKVESGPVFWWPILSVLFREPDGHWRTVALPPLCPDNINHLVSGTLVNMDTLHLVYPPPIYPFKVNRQNVLKGPPLDFTYSVNKTWQIKLLNGIHTRVSCYSDMHTKCYSDMHDSFVLDSISIGSNSGDRTNAGHDEKHAEKEIFKTDISKLPGLSSRKGRFSCQRFLNDVVGNYDHTEEARHGIQGCRSNDMQLVVPNKRSKQNKVAPRTANVSKFGSNGNLHIHYKQNKLILSIN